MVSLPVAADYPFLDALWSMLVFVGFVFWIWLATSFDVFRRRDMSGFVKAFWILAVILIPVLGVLVYLIAYHGSIADRNVKQAEAAQAAFDQQVRQAAGTAGPASENRDREPARGRHDLPKRSSTGSRPKRSPHLDDRERRGRPPRGQTLSTRTLAARACAKPRGATPPRSSSAVPSARTRRKLVLEIGTRTAERPAGACLS